jgi:hypothetical protein
MALTCVKYISDTTLDGLATKLNAAIGDGWQPFGPTLVTGAPGNEVFSSQVVQGTPVGGGGDVEIDASQITTGTIAADRLPVATDTDLGIASFGADFTVTDGAVALSA